MFSQCCPKLKFHTVIQLGQISVMYSGIVVTLFYVLSHVHVHYSL